MRLPTFLLTILPVLFCIGKGHPSVSHQNLTLDDPFPILEIGYRHILPQIGPNITVAEKASLNDAGGKHQRRYGFEFGNEMVSRNVLLNKRASTAQCGVGVTCIDGSCCNSEGNCGFTPYTCNTTAMTSCISNCNAHAPCGVNSLYGDQNCALNICCSYFGYCGTTSTYCNAQDAAGTTLPCQEGYGSCEVAPAPSCRNGTTSTSRGRKVAYYQGSGCNRISPSQINTTGLTHLNFAFAGIDPVSFEIVPAFELDYVLYPQFTALKSAKMQTWIAIGGGDFSAPGSSTFTTFSDLVTTPSNREAFIVSLSQFMRQWGFQGVDIDWEFPSLAVNGGRPTDADNFVMLLREMREDFGSTFGISAVLPPDYTELSGNDPVGMADYVDFFNFMSYDLHGPWEAPILGAFIRSQTSIQDINSALQPLWFAGIPPSKINLGIAYYGRGFTLSNTSCADIGCPYTGGNNPGNCTQSSGLLSLREIKRIIEEKELIPKLIEDEMIKQISWEDQWIGYDDEETIAMKIGWADESCLGGIGIWSLDLYSGAGTGDTLLTISPNGTCANDHICLNSPLGNCCSSNNTCGSTIQHCDPSLGCQLLYGVCTLDSAAGIRMSSNGTCGNGVTCVGTSFGDCCSGSGFCASSPNLCSPDSGCQPLFGACVTPGSGPVSMDGSCGALGSKQTCLGSEYGNCCSMYGYCGNGTAWCGDGCQPLYGICG